MFSLRKIFLAFVPLFMINSALPMFRRATTTQNRNLLATRTVTTRSRSFANRTVTRRTAALFKQTKTPITRIVAQRTTTPVHRSTFSSQRANHSWFDWGKFKKRTWAIGAFALGYKVSQKNNILAADAKSDEITLESLFDVFAFRCSMESFIENLTENQFNQLIKVLTTNLSFLSKKKYFHLFIKAVLLRKPEVIQELIGPAIENITTIDHQVIFIIFEKRPEAVKQFIQPIIDNITKIDPEIVRVMIRKNPTITGQLVQLSLDNIEKIKPALLVELPLKCNKKIKDLIVRLQKQDTGNIDTALKILILSRVICDQPDYDFKCNTQTCQHLRQNITSRSFNHYSDVAPRLLDLVSKVNKKERKLQETHYTFFHGQRWEYQFAASLFIKLYEFKTGNKYPEFLFAHVKKLPENIKSEEKVHTKLLKYGQTDSVSRQRLLFLNYAFFANSKKPVGPPVSYNILHNDNFGFITITLKQMFLWCDFEHIYEKYQDELQQLEKEHEWLSERGNLLFIAVPKDIVDKCVFSAKPGGYKKTILIKKGWLWDSKITKTSELLEAIKAGKIQETDLQEFCLIMTNSKYGGLNPESGIKIFDFNTVEEEKWAAYKAKEDALFERIKADILDMQSEEKEMSVA